MATLNCSANGAQITKTYQSVVDAPLPAGGAATSQAQTHAHWALYSVAAPLVSAFQQEGGKESVLKVQATGEGELAELIDEFSDGRIQFAFVKVQDQNSKLPKNVLIAWCGEGVPERTKGYFTSHLAAVSKLLHGYHVQVTARTDADLTPENIVRKVSDASGSKYGGDSMPGGTASPIAAKAKPAFMPTSTGGRGGRMVSRTGAVAGESSTFDSDGWGVDAPRITRSTLEKVQPAYKPTRVNMAELTSQKQEPSRFQGRDSSHNSNSDVVRGGYQPIGKIDIAAIRREAQAAGSTGDDRPAPVKGSYEPIGQVDIAAIRAKAQQPDSSAGETPKASGVIDTDNKQAPRSLADRSAAFTSSERITAMPKPKVSNRFGGSTSNFSGTRAPAPTSYGGVTTAPIGVASRTFADEGGKTPSQIWAEKKSRERGASGAAETSRSSNGSPPASHASGGDGSRSGYSGKSWAPVSTARTGQPASEQVEDHEPQEPALPSGDVKAIRDRFSTAAPMGRPSAPSENTSLTSPPPMDMASKPRSEGVAMPGLPSRVPQFEADVDQEDEEIPAEETTRMPTPPAQPPRSPSPETPEMESSGSPIRLAMPISRTQEKAIAPAVQQMPVMPIGSLANAVPGAEDLEDEPELEQEDPARGAGAAMAVSTFGVGAALAAAPGASIGGKSAVVQYNYEKAEDNELELKEGDTVSNIEMVDEDWWMGTNPQGESGLFPSNYVELIEAGAPPASAAHTASTAPAAVIPAATGPAGGANKAATATAQFDYEAAEENELSFPDGATIENIEFLDEDWWQGEYEGHTGLFPANYVTLGE